MAANRGAQFQRTVMSEPRVNALPRQNFLSSIDDRFLFNQISRGKEESKPNNYYTWKPSSTFAEPAVGPERSKKSKNREREQNFAGQQDSPGFLLSNGPSRHRTPATYPRTQLISSAIEKEELENLRYQMTFSDMDDQSTDSRVLGSVSRANGVNNNRPFETWMPDGAGKRPASVLDTIFVNELPDRNKIVARLMQIRDYLKQANAMMVTLQNATESAEKTDQVCKLQRLQDHLTEQERGYLALLERMLAEELGATTSVSGLSAFESSSVATSNDLNLNLNVQEEAGDGVAGGEQAANGRSSQNSGESFATSLAETASINIDARSDISEATTGQKGQKVTDQIEALEGLRKQHDLLRKMLKQQEELKTLQSRQAALMSLQSQLEYRMQNSDQERAEETLSTSTQATTTTATSVTEDAAPVTTTAGAKLGGGRFSAGVPMTASDLQERRRTLMRMLAEQEHSHTTEIQQATRADWLDQRQAAEASEVAPPLISAEHQELREKLEALQDKKRQMDELLLQLHALHPNMPNIGGDTSSIASTTTSNANESLVAMMLGQGTETSDDNEATLTNGPDSLRKLHEVRERLTELRDLVQQYQDTSQVLDDQVQDAGRQQQQHMSLTANFEDPDLLSNLRRLERGEQLGRLANEMIYGGDGAHVQVGSGQTTSTVTETETETETESNHSSILAAWGDDPEIQEKVRKLKEAKQKLRQLQSLVAMVQQTPEVATALPDDLAELAADLTADYSELTNDGGDDDEEEEKDEEEETVEDTDSELVMGGGRGDQRNQGTSSLSEGEVPQEVMRETKEAYYEAKMQQQRRELQTLMAERQRLLGVQQQLKELNENLPPVNKESAKPKIKSVNIAPMKRSVATSMNPRASSNSSNLASMATPSRDEVYGEMVRNKMLQEELRQKKNELQDLLRIVKHKRERLRDGSDEHGALPTDLAEYDNDLFRELLLDAGRMSMRSADITAAATWGGSTQESEDEGLDDGYPSDGILQVEEEEEQEGSTVTSETYTIESGSKPYRPQSYPGGRRVTMEDDGETSSMDAARHGIRYPKKLNSMQTRQAHPRQENIQPAEDLMSETYEAQASAIQSLQGHINQLQRQLGNSMSLCQSLITDQQSMSNLLTGSLNGGYGSLQQQLGAPSPNPYSSASRQQPPSGVGLGGGDPPLDDLVENYNVRLQHQQLMLNLNSAYNQLYRQQEQIQGLRSQLEERASSSEVSYDIAANTNANNNAPLGYPRGVGPWNAAAVGYPSGPYGRSPAVGPPDFPPPSQRGAAYNPGMPFNMTPNFPAGFSQPSPAEFPAPFESNPYGPMKLGTDARDEYIPYARQPQLPPHQYSSIPATSAAAVASYNVPPNTAQASNDDDEFESAYLNGTSRFGPKRRTLQGGRTLDSGIGDLIDDLARDTIDMREPAVPPLNIASLLRRTENQRRVREDLGSERSNASSSKAGGRRGRPSSASQGRSQLYGQSQPSARLAKLVGPSSMGQGLSSSISGTAFLDTASMVSTMSMSSMPGELSDRSSQPDVKPKTSSTSRHQGRLQQRQKQQQQYQQDTDRSVRSQTSELESDAGSEFSLFEALRESIYSEVASLISQNETRPHFLIELFRELQMLNSDYLRQRALYALQELVSKYLTDDNTTNASASETATLPSERPIPAWMMFAGSEQTPSESFITSDEDEIKARLFGMGQPRAHESSYVVMDDQYDYIENVDSASTLSTPRSAVQGDFGFANEDLGDTVIHLDKALKRMREFERMKAEAEATSGNTSSVDNKDRGAMSASDMTSNSSAQDMGSESSFSDLPYPRIDTRQLDLQIKGIMQEVIPYLKEHMDDVCSPQLLAYIRRLVLGLARQRDESREFVRFFNRQLGSILEDSLAKFSGRKMRECGEDLLVDISEILFNELAFFRLMQDLDTAGNKLKQEAAKRDGEGDDDEDEDDEEEEEETDRDDQTETGTETGTAQEHDDESSSSSSSSSDEDDDTVNQRTPQGRHQQGGAGSGQMEDALESAMAVASRYEEEQLGNARDDVMALEIDVSDREEDSEPQGVDHLQIELSMSESKGVTYIGSGEEEDDPDELGETVEETITSIGAANADGEGDSVDDTTVSTVVLTETDSSLQEDVSKQESIEKDPTPSTPAPAPAPDCAQGEGEGEGPANPAPAEPKDAPAPGLQDEPTAGMGDNNNDEITMDDLPPKLTVLSQTDLDSQMSKEQANMDGMQGVLETMATGEGQLAGDPLAVTLPEGTPMENGLNGAEAGDIGSE